MDVVQRVEQSGNSESPMLVDRMDSAIGEASTSIGMIMSELVRRSLRGGVGEIGVSIHDYARDQVNNAIDEMMPGVSLVVEELAETTSQRITDSAVQKFGEELKSVELRTTERTEVIAVRLKAETDAAIEVVTRAVGESRETTDTTARDLKDLHQRAKDSWKKMQLELQAINDARVALEQQLAETRQQLADALQRLDIGQRQLAETREQLDSSRSLLSETGKRLGQSQEDLTRTQQDLAEATRGLADLGHRSSQKMTGLESASAALAKRLDELERPKGIRALFSKLTGGKKNALGIADQSTEPRHDESDETPG